MKKKIALMICLVSCLMMFAGCSMTRENKNISESKLNKASEQFVEQWFETDFKGTKEQLELSIEQLQEIEKMGSSVSPLENEQIAEYKELLAKYEDVLAEYKANIKTMKKHGDLKKIKKVSYSAASDTASVTVRVDTEKSSDLVFTLSYDKTGEMTEYKVEEYRAVSQIMGRAGLNTVMSIAIVFAVLIFISLLISCFKFIGGSKKKEEAPAQETVVETPVVEENLADDLELVAVITAAIAAASENESTDGLVVRSIVRRY